MKPHLASLLRCSSCRGRLGLDASAIERVDRPLPERLPPCSGLCGKPASIAGCADCAVLEVVGGSLVCRSCERRYAIANGVPWMAPPSALADEVKTRTASSFGHLWARSIPAPDAAPRDYHFEKMARALSFRTPQGLVLDGGCGDGIDLRNRAGTAGAEVVGVELSEGGCRTTARRIMRLPNAHVVQADLGRLPFEDRTFDFVYSYGVLHHLSAPQDGLRELARVAGPGAPVAIYLYEDFSDRSPIWRMLLTLANLPRVVTIRTPHGMLFRLCQIASPLIFLTFTLPHRALRHLPMLRLFADSLPFRHGKGPFSLAGDLYDRFSAPVEYRYSREGAQKFVQNAGLTVRTIAKERGWMVLAERNNDTGLTASDSAGRRNVG